jgi:hypothetical protein
MVGEGKRHRGVKGEGRWRQLGGDRGGGGIPSLTFHPAGV